MNAATLFEQLKKLRDTLKLKAHLLEMELQDEWQELEKKAHELEIHLVQRARQLGVAEEHYYVGSDQEIKKLVDAMSDLDAKAKNSERKNS